MRKLSPIFALILTGLLAGVALAWAPSGRGVCNSDTGVVTYTITLHAEPKNGTSVGSYQINDAGLFIVYHDGEVITITNTGAAVKVTEFQNEQSVSETFGPVRCAQPTATPSPSPSASPSPTATPSETPVATPVVTPSETPTATATIPNTAVELPNFGAPILTFGGILIVGLALLLIANAAFRRKS
jgi:hypothetical protein